MDDRYFDTPKAALASPDQGHEPKKERVFAAILLGQLLSFLLALSGTISSLLVTKVGNPHDRLGASAVEIHRYFGSSCCSRTYFI